jgi:hypothetical protein
MPKYYCHYCSIFIFGDGPDRLARNVNDHNDIHHRFETNNWTALSITHSSYYVDPVLMKTPPGALARYTEPHGLTSQREWGDALRPPDITDEDRAMLAKAHIKW